MGKGEQTLVLKGCGMSSANALVLLQSTRPQSLTSLQNLDLSGNALIVAETQAAVVGAVDGAVETETGDVLGGVLAAAGPSLKRLRLAYCALGPISPLTRGLSACSNLTAIDLSSNAIADSTKLAAVIANDLLCLNTLDLRHNRLRNVGTHGIVLALAVTPAKRGRVRLYLDDNGIDTDAVGVLPLAKIDLAELTVGCNAIGVDGVQALVMWKSDVWLKRVEGLRVSGVASEGGILSASPFLYVLPKMHSLKTLDVSGNNLLYSDVCCLCAALKTVPSVEKLSLSNNDLGTKGALVVVDFLNERGNSPSLVFRV